MLRSVFATLISLVALIGTASAETVITNDGGGLILTYLLKYENLRDSGDRLVIDGPCLSACTLFTKVIPRDRVCVTGRAILGFHAPTLYHMDTGVYTPSNRDIPAVMAMYPKPIRAWITRHGGLTHQLKFLRGRELTRMYAPCPVGY